MNYRTRKEDCFSEESYGKSVPIDSINKQLSDFGVVEEIEKDRVDEPGRGFTSKCDDFMDFAHAISHR